MSFDDVELARKRYNSQREALKRKRLKIFLVLFVVIFVIQITYFIIVKPISFSKGSSDIWLRDALPILQIISIFFFELIAAGLVAFFVTIFDSKKVTIAYIDYKHLYKAYFVQLQLEKIFTDLKYSHEKGLDRSILDSSGLIYTGDIYKSNDLIEAKYKKVHFAQADVEIINEEELGQPSDNHTKYVTVFKGRYLVFEFPKIFISKMVITRNLFSRLYLVAKNKHKLTRIETESPEFNKHFAVYAERGPEVFYILTPDFIYNLEQLGKKYKNALSLYFSDNKMYVGLNDRNDAFEPPSPSTPLDEKTETEKVINDMKLITNLVDSLKLSR